MKRVLPIQKYIKFTHTASFKLYDEHYQERVELDAGEYCFPASDFDGQIVYVDNDVTIEHSPVQMMTKQDVTNLFWRLNQLIDKAEAITAEESTQGTATRTAINAISTVLEGVHTLVEELLDVTLTKLDYLDQSVKEEDSPTFAGVKTDNKTIKQRVVDIGYWNMTGTGSVNLSCDIPDEDILSIHGYLIDDSETNRFELYGGHTSGDAHIYVNWYWDTDHTNIYLGRNSSGYYDNNTNFDATDVNRGKLIITYEA